MNEGPMPDELPITPDLPATAPKAPTETGSLQLSKTRLLPAFGSAAISDAVGAFLMPAPPIAWAADLATAALLFIVLGWHWLLLPGLVMEAIPGLGVIPLWLLVVAAIAVWGMPRPRLKR